VKGEGLSFEDSPKRNRLPRVPGSRDVTGTTLKTKRNCVQVRNAMKMLSKAKAVSMRWNTPPLNVETMTPKSKLSGLRNSTEVLDDCFRVQKLHGSEWDC
jgi:hypothetical protein